jgi:hypothetical protein
VNVGTSLAVDETGLVIDLRAESGGAVLVTEPVRVGDLAEAIDEVWWRGFARRGAFDTDVRDMDLRLAPVPSQKEPGRCHGFVLETGGADGEKVALTCSLTLFNPVARRCATELCRRGVLKENDTFLYALRSPGGEDSRPIHRSTSGQGAVLSRTRDTSFETLSLSSLEECSRPGVAIASGDHYLFYTETALQRAEAISRQGEQRQPAVESGGVLLGMVGWCPQARDAFVVVVDALEAQDADQEEFSLSFSGRTWSRLQTVLKARRSQPGQQALRILGQTHSHPFSPGEPCAACPETPDCPKQTAILSDEDRRWSRAVFAGQPWQVGHLWGINARGEPTSTVYGLCGGRLEPRGYRVIADTDLDHIRHANAKKKGDN